MELDDLRHELFSTNDGQVACDAINSLAKLAVKGSEEAKTALAAYVQDGSIKHMCEHACSSLASAIKEPDAKYAAVFRKGLDEPNLRYWSILGFLNSTGRDAYPKLIQLAEDRSLTLNQRAHSVKCLSKYSKQQFDRGLTSDPGFWQEADLRLTELRLWAESGYPDGLGYPQPDRHQALDNPQTPFEKMVRKFDDMLAKKRAERQDLAEPTDCLVPACPQDIERIKARWTLPGIYLDFLRRFSPLRVTITRGQFWNPFWLFGAAELLEAQAEDWPEHLVVIAIHGGDPYVLDLSQSNGQEAPVLTAVDSGGPWEFEPVARSFAEFLEHLVTQKLRVLP